MVCIAMLSDLTFNSDQLFEQETFEGTSNLMGVTKASVARPLRLSSK